MKGLAILWDAAPIWGLLAWRAATAFGLPFRLVKAADLQNARRDAPGDTLADSSVLIVPGGPARQKSLALGPEGRATLRAWVEQGGQYLGFCGGAGLGLTTPDGLSLCPWRRAPITHWSQHFVSGHVRAALTPGHELSADKSLLALPVWWPGRFAAPDTEDPGPEAPGDGVTVLARYAGVSPELCRQPRYADFCVADLPLGSLDDDLLAAWARHYDFSLNPSFLEGQPCVLHGRLGQGGYLLSYSHLETPDSPEANRWLAQILARLTGLNPLRQEVPDWTPAADPPCRDDVLTPARRELEEILCLGLEQGLLFPRTSWLTGWRAGVPGAALNHLHMNLCLLTSLESSDEAEAARLAALPRLARLFRRFFRQLRENLLAFRLSATAPEAVPRDLVIRRRNALFGTAMQSGGLYRDLMEILDDLLFLALRDGATP